eukprot:CAMPEP_0115346058 /NCGR_PEP_ID=MMETSP0270-20121206/94141_2 /TAXON_ID=71861 /ORGANISM="Scrippsiella trochoidea, Strain CCMP3099" /LENGTH=74 /DNA_ID=CAMNT_0002767881 /DNA_START=442 /DNA_END=663 /DNA_ORIENTATION=-
MPDSSVPYSPGLVGDDIFSGALAVNLRCVEAPEESVDQGRVKSMRKFGSTTEFVSFKPTLTDCTVACVSSRRAC